MSAAIKFENISKQYRLGLVSTRTISHDLNRWWQTSILRKDDPYLKIGEVNDRAHKGQSDYVWALKDINFEVQQGDVLGIIGKNGAGKSTLLKILSKVTAPTTGTIKAKGRIASLLEVGTGFHPEMTGRENIFMNGSIMGMSKAEINRKLDEIVDFAGVERYLDTPVKRYSSGMTVRLGFAIAAHLDPEILVVDEVLAVGDAEFQKKAIGKMQDVSKGEGRTVLFVSHNMASLLTLTFRSILLDNGSILDYDLTDSIVNKYLKLNLDQNKSIWIANEDNKFPLQISKIELLNIKGENTNDFRVSDDIIVKIQYRVKERILGANVSVNIENDNGVHVMSLEDIDTFKEFLFGREIGTYETSVCIKGNLLNQGLYFVRVGSGIPQKMIFDSINVLGINIIQTNDSLVNNHRKGILLPNLNWTYKKLQ